MHKRRGATLVAHHELRTKQQLVVAGAHARAGNEVAGSVILPAEVCQQPQPLRHVVAETEVEPRCIAEVTAELGPVQRKTAKHLGSGRVVECFCLREGCHRAKQNDTRDRKTKFHGIPHTALA